MIGVLIFVTTQKHSLALQAAYSKSVFARITWLQIPRLVKYNGSLRGLLIRQQPYFYTEKLTLYNHSQQQINF